jgi:hypothetical protein
MPCSGVAQRCFSDADEWRENPHPLKITKGAAPATCPDESYKLGDLKKILTFTKQKWGTQPRNVRETTKLLFRWCGWIVEDFVGAYDLAVEGAGN